MIIDTYPLGVLQTNCYILHDFNEAIIFDPGSEPDKLIQIIDDTNLKPVKILNTHGHFDHIGAISAVKEKYGIELHMHKDDQEIIDMSSMATDYYGLPSIVAPAIDHFVNHGDIFRFKDLTIEAIHTPGHTMGCTCYHIREMHTLITGDTLFYNAVGRTDFPYSSFTMLEDSIRNRLYSLPDDTEVLPGHDIPTTIGFEKSNNPSVRL